MGRLRILCSGAVLLAAGAGCTQSPERATTTSGAQAKPTTSRTAAGTPVATFTLDEWWVDGPTEFKAGSMRIEARNVGAEIHELVIVRAKDPSALPKNPDGSVDEDKIAKADVVGEIPDVTPGANATKEFNIPKGSYVAFCNIVDSMGMSGNDTHMGSGPMGSGPMGSEGMGHGHFRLGMVTTFTVS